MCDVTRGLILSLSGCTTYHPPSKGVPERQRGWGMLVRLLANLLLNPINIPLRPAARSLAGRGPPSKGELLDPGHAFYQQPRYITGSLLMVLLIHHLQLSIHHSPLEASSFRAEDGETFKGHARSSTDAFDLNLLDLGAHPGHHLHRVGGGEKFHGQRGDRREVSHAWAGGASSKVLGPERVFAGSDP